MNWWFLGGLALWLISLATFWLSAEKSLAGPGRRIGWPWRRCVISPVDARWLAEALGEHQCPLCDRAITDHFAR